MAGPSALLPVASDATRADDNMVKHWFQGHLLDLDGSLVKLSIETRRVAEVLINRSSCTACFKWRREGSDIRSNVRSDYVVYFVKNSAMTLTGPFGTHRVRAGEFTVIHTGMPILFDTHCSQNKALEVITAIVPERVMLRLPRTAIQIGTAYHGTPHALAALAQFETLLDHGEGLDDEVADRITHAALLALIRAIEGENEHEGHGTEQDPRLRRIRYFIETNLENPGLNGREVAHGCDMSLRQMHYVLSGNHTSLDQLIWKTRLAKTAELLASDDTSGRRIYEIAQACGFKNYEHFCRAFKKEYGCSPRAFRAH